MPTPCQSDNNSSLSFHTGELKTTALHGDAKRSAVAAFRKFKVKTGA